MHRKVSASVLASALLLAGLSGCDSGREPASTESASTAGQAAPAAAAPAAEAARPTHGAVDEARLLAADNEPGQWMTYGGTYHEQRFSRLTQITPDNVGQLGLAWFADFDTHRGQESTPLVVDGVIYVTQAWSKVNAYDAKTGAPLWAYDPKVPGERGAMGCCDVVNRGVAIWNGKVYVGAYDGRLIALDAKTGGEVWSTQTFIDYEKYYSSTGAPRVVKGKVLIGNAGAEYETRGYVSAYDAQTGELAWRFFTVPGNPADGFESPAMEAAARTWIGEWWKLGGGGSTWDGITYDPVTDTVFVGVGNGSPWNPELRSPDGGDNLYTVSIVALDPDTGDLKWHWQQIPWEEWDFDAVQQITVADLEIDGALRHVIMQATKSGFFFVLDAATGKLLSANNFVPVNWTLGYDLDTGKPIINPDAQYTRNEGAIIVRPGPQGAHNWQPMSYSPVTGHVYIPAQDVSLPLINAPDSQFGAFKLGVDWISGMSAYDRPGNTIPREGKAKLIAWDPITQQEVWSRTYDGQPAGVFSTVTGLLFQTDGAAQEFVAYRTDNGERLWGFPIQTGGRAGGISYEVDGEQYVAVVVGGQQRGGYYAPSYSRLLAFKLGGTATLPEPVPYTPPELNPPELMASNEVLQAGQQAYNGFCSMCHGTGGASRGMFPDLRYSATLHSAEAFDAIVLQGVLSGKGMASFAGRLDRSQSDAIRNYIIAQAIEAKNNPAPQFGPGAGGGNRAEAADEGEQRDGEGGHEL